MGQRPSPGFREPLAATLDARLTPGEAARRVRVSVRSLYHWLVPHPRNRVMLHGVEHLGRRLRPFVEHEILRPAASE
jgi:hypothetical protein